MMKKFIILITYLIFLVSCEVTEPDKMLSFPTTPEPFVYLFGLDGPSEVKIDVFNAYNTFIVNLVDTSYSTPGQSVAFVVWNFEDANKNKVAEGIYYIELFINNKLKERTTYSLSNQ